MEATALYRSRAGEPWQDVELVDRHWPSGAYVVRETGRVLPGVFLAFADQLRVPGPILEFHEPFGNEPRAA